MKRSALLLIAGIVSLALCSAAAGTQLVNKNFEGGNLSGWVLTRDDFFPGVEWAQAVDSRFAPPLQGQFSALLVHREGDALDCPSADDPWAIICPTPIPFGSAPLVQVAAAPPYTIADWAGTFVAMTQQVSLRAGNVLSFDFQTFGQDDIFFAVLTSAPPGGDTQTIICWENRNGPCNSPFSLFLPSFTPNILNPPNPHYITPTPTFLRSSPVSSAPGFSGIGSYSIGDIYRLSLPVPYANTWTLTVGIGDGSADGFVSTGVLVDNFQVRPGQAPEPSTLALLSLGLLAFVGRRKV